MVLTALKHEIYLNVSLTLNLQASLSKVLISTKKTQMNSSNDDSVVMQMIVAKLGK